jgi:hypothetical protein
MELEGVLPRLLKDPFPDVVTDSDAPFLPELSEDWLLDFPFKRYPSLGMYKDMGPSKSSCPSSRSSFDIMSASPLKHSSLSGDMMFKES